MFYLSALIGVLTATMLTANCLPKFLAASLYIRTYYQYSIQRFDNTWPTFVTDYGLTLHMCYGIYRLMKCERSELRNFSAALLLFYAISVTVGGISHQFFTSVDMMNTIMFRLMWSVVVGTVTSAGGFLGSIGSSFAKMARGSERKRFTVVVVPSWWWAVWSIFLTALVFWGFLSMERPAADIFLAGVTQTAPTCYMVVCALSNEWKGNQKSIKKYLVILTIGAFLNAPLLPLYGILVNFGLELGTVNTILHCWLAAAWGMQGIALRGLSEHIVREAKLVKNA